MIVKKSLKDLDDIKYQLSFYSEREKQAMRELFLLFSVVFLGSFTIFFSVVQLQLFYPKSSTAQLIINAVVIIFVLALFFLIRPHVRGLREAQQYYNAKL